MKSKLFFLILLLFFFLRCISDVPFKVNNTTAPENLGDGWEICLPESSGIAMDSLKKTHEMLMDESHYYNVLGFLIVKDGKIGFESYPRNISDRDRYHHVQSVTKSFTSMLFGMALKDGYIDSLNDPVSKYLPDKVPDDSLKHSITLAHLLNMRSGLNIDNSDFAYTMMIEKPKDFARYCFNLPLFANPGDSVYYRDCDPQLISYCLQRVTGKTEEQLADQRIFKPLGITDYFWDKNTENVSTGAFGLFIKPRDLAKVGQMLVDNGKWNGVQIADSSWMALATKPWGQIPWDNAIYQYGYYWWLLPQLGGYSACGHGGSFLFIQPKKKLVIVMISMPDAGDNVGTLLPGFIELISPVVNGSR